MVSNLSLSLGNKRTAGSSAARRWGRRLLVAAVALVVGLPLVYAIFQGVTSIDPPAIPREVALAAQQPVDQKGPRSYLGK